MTVALVTSKIDDDTVHHLTCLLQLLNGDLINWKRVVPKTPSNPILEIIKGYQELEIELRYERSKLSYKNFELIRITVSEENEVIECAKRKKVAHSTTLIKRRDTESFKDRFTKWIRIKE